MISTSVLSMVQPTDNSQLNTTNSPCQNHIAKQRVINNIKNFSSWATRELESLDSYIKDDVEDYLKYVIKLHLNIMFKNRDDIRTYLESLAVEKGIIFVKLVINFPIVHAERYYLICEDCDYNDSNVLINSNSVNAFICAAMWNTDSRVITLLLDWGANINSMNEYGYFADEISFSDNYYSAYYNHLQEYLNLENCDINYFGDRCYNDFKNVIRQILFAAGELL